MWQCVICSLLGEEAPVLAATVAQLAGWQVEYEEWRRCRPATGGRLASPGRVQDARSAGSSPHHQRRVRTPPTRPPARLAFLRFAGWCKIAPRFWLRRYLEHLGASMLPTLNQLLQDMVGQGGADLHITTNSPPQVRIDGVLRQMNLPPLTPTETKQLCYSILTDNQKHRLEENLEIDLSFGLKGLARFRANIFHQRGAIAAVFRQIPFEIRGFRELGLPAVIERMCEKPRGLVLVTGPTGSGKSTTLAAMLDKVNRERHEHIVTVE